jgi:ATP-dependent DNA helicase RecG
VAQRSKLWHKNTIPPHILVMTATPIPRTLAMTLYGDLSVSVIDELPPGRKPIQTFHQYDTNRAKLYHFMRMEIAKGRQVYVVFPLIKESENSIFRTSPPDTNVCVQSFLNHNIIYVWFTAR